MSQQRKLKKALMDYKGIATKELKKIFVASKGKPVYDMVSAIKKYKILLSTGRRCARRQ